MTVAYFDCFAGISGDMTLGALIDSGADPALLDATIEALRLGDEASIEVRHETRGHVGGTRVVVQTADRVERTVPALRAVVEDAEAAHIRRVLDFTGNHKGEAARILGITRKNLWEKMRQYGMGDSQP